MSPFSGFRIALCSQLQNKSVGSISSILSTNGAPIVVSLPNLGVVGIAKDTQIHYFGENGDRVSHLESCRFAETPIAVGEMQNFCSTFVCRISAYDPPYLIALLPRDAVEIRSVKPEMAIQRFPLPKPALIHVASP